MFLCFQEEEKITAGFLTGKLFSGFFFLAAKC